MGEMVKGGILNSDDIRNSVNVMSLTHTLRYEAVLQKLYIFVDELP